MMFGMVLVISSELKAPLMAADKPAADAQPGTLAYDCKVMVVDRAARTVTVEIQKRLYLFKFGPNTTVVRKGKKVKIEDVIAGQQITLQLIQTNDGQVQIASANIGTSTAAEPAGKSSADSSTQTPGPSTISAPGSPSTRSTVSPYN
jgi:hypothetical protein